MRLIVWKERPHLGAQLRLTDIDGHRFTCFATSARAGQLADLELRHRRRARCEDRILLQASSACRMTWRQRRAERLPQHVSGAAVLAVSAAQMPGRSRRANNRNTDERHVPWSCQGERRKVLFVPWRSVSCAKDTGLRNLPLQGYAQNQLWREIIAMASELLAWMAMLALDGKARRWEPKQLRLRLFSAAGKLARGGRRLRLRLATRWPWNQLITTAISRSRH